MQKLFSWRNQVQRPLSRKTRCKFDCLEGFPFQKHSADKLVGSPLVTEHDKSFDVLCTCKGFQDVLVTPNGEVGRERNVFEERTGSDDVADEPLASLSHQTAAVPHELQGTNVSGRFTQTIQGTSPAEDANSEKIGADRVLNKHLISLLTTVQAHSYQLDQMVKHLNSLVRRVESVESIFSDGQEQIHQSVAEFRSDTEKIVLQTADRIKLTLQPTLKMFTDSLSSANRQLEAVRLQFEQQTTSESHSKDEVPTRADKPIEIPKGRAPSSHLAARRSMSRRKSQAVRPNSTQQDPGSFDHGLDLQKAHSKKRARSQTPTGLDREHTVHTKSISSTQLRRISSQQTTHNATSCTILSEDCHHQQSSQVIGQAQINSVVHKKPLKKNQRPLLLEEHV
ncbi:hypothetical protein PGT21_014196 [Puccinia graminis f. sp. tritici]|uniref:Uncharacterized protein n=1 Tax=Puccinia graminis f. sp. tritici TaxID=56615 RepID=A0A5B0NHF9_PUCGR|nr:hypothetical protein PGT21_014196 [Puccinia graminis f. sp. tritici]KAA1088012.1 hypothetical protein PGTUg99_018804 [Puccinia graminis f. sp. tritici]